MKRLSTVFLSALLLVLTAVSCCNGKSSEKEEYAGRVKAAFSKAWTSYMTYAKGMDAVNPISHEGHNWYDESLLMTPVDAFTTMYTMGLEKEMAEAKELIFNNLSFDKDMYVQQFEIAIRMLGGLLSAYQLDGDERFLDMAKDLGDRMMPVFDSPTGIPFKMVNLRTGAVKETQTNPCEVGSMLLEYGMLSRLTGNPEYYEKCKRGVTAGFDRRNPETNLIGCQIDIETGEWLNTASHISGGIDAYYEYLLKGWLLFGDEDLKKMWEIARVAIDKYVKDEVESGLWYGQVDMNTGKRLGTWFGALDCFFGAVLCLDGDMENAEKLQQSIYKMWTMHGIEPESVDYSTMQIMNPMYYGRPEAIEAAYYCWVYTGDEQYYEQGKTMFESIEKYCQLEDGYCQLKDVRTMEKENTLESFFYAETLMYCYLFFADKEDFDFDKVILNTEAHPFLKEAK